MLVVQRVAVSVGKPAARFLGVLSVVARLALRELPVAAHAGRDHTAWGVQALVRRNHPVLVPNVWDCRRGRALGTVVAVVTSSDDSLVVERVGEVLVGGVNAVAAILVARATGVVWPVRFWPVLPVIPVVLAARFQFFSKGPIPLFQRKKYLKALTLF